ncbi:MAG: OmpA family protein [Bacteroidales bacterium]|nr:OmpA family protein [Bacteroidales bacterium]
MKKIAALLVAGALVLTGCNMSKLASGSLIGSGAGAAIGAGIGYLIGGDGQSAAIGAAAGMAVGGGTGAVIGHQMDKKAAELKELENAQIETVEDVNGLKAIKVTFSSGILFPTNGTTLTDAAQAELKKFAADMADMEMTNITVYGHTDNTGTAAVNERISTQRAQAVSKVLEKNGIAGKRITTQGLSFNFPVADNNTVEGRAQNRRVEIYVSANEEMIKAAEQAAQQN